MDDQSPRLVEDPGLSPLARAVLRSAESDAPSATSRHAVARALGLATLTTQSAAAVAGASSAWWLVPLIVVAVAGAGTIGVVATTRDAQPMPHVLVPTAGAPIPAPPAIPAPAKVEPAVVPAVPAEVVAESLPRPVHTPRRTAARAATAPVAPVADVPEVSESAAVAPPPIEAPPAPAVVDARRLAVEVGLLDRARAHLEAGDAATALAALDEHARTFSDGLLGAEAEVLRIDALLRQGERAAAQARGEQFLARFPRSPLAQRVRSLLAPSRDHQQPARQSQEGGKP